MARMVIWRQRWDDFADDAAFLSAWTVAQTGTATATWDLDSTHVVNSTKSAHLTLTGTRAAGDVFEVTATRSGLTPGATYVFTRRIYSLHTVVGGQPVGQFNAFSVTLTADASGDVTVFCRVTDVTGGDTADEFWFDDLSLAAVWEGQGTKPADALIDAGVLYVGETPAGFGASQGGLGFDPHVEIRQIPFDGGRVGKAGLDWKPGSVPVIKGTMIEASAAALLRYEPAMGSDGSSPVNRLTPASHGPLFVAGDYLTNVTLWCRESDGSVLRVIFPTAYVAKRSLTMAGGVEGRWDIEIWGVHPPGTADLTVPPYYYEVES